MRLFKEIFIYLKKNTVKNLFLIKREFLLKSYFSTVKEENNVIAQIFWEIKMYSLPQDCRETKQEIYILTSLLSH